MESFWNEDKAIMFARWYNIVQATDKKSIADLADTFKKMIGEPKNTVWGNSAMTSEPKNWADKYAAGVDPLNKDKIPTPIFPSQLADALNKKEEPKKYPLGILRFRIKDYSGGMIEYINEKHYQSWCKWHFEHDSTIHSVQNSKKEIFTIQDMTTDGRLIKFKIKDGLLFAVFFRDYSIPNTLRIERKEIELHIDTLTKVEKQPLFKFKSDDGFDMFAGDTYFATTEEDISLTYMLLTIDENFNLERANRKKGTMRFKEESNAKKYIAENKPSISYKELSDWLNELLNKFKPQ